MEIDSRLRRARRRSAYGNVRSLHQTARSSPTVLSARTPCARLSPLLHAFAHWDEKQKAHARVNIGERAFAEAALLVILQCATRIQTVTVTITELRTSRIQTKFEHHSHAWRVHLNGHRVFVGCREHQTAMECCCSIIARPH